MGKSTSIDFLSTYNLDSTIASSSTRPMPLRRRSHPKSSPIKGGEVPATTTMFSPTSNVTNDTNTEPFPDIIHVLNLFPKEEPVLMHCVHHCTDSICKRLVGMERDVPPCCCADERPKRTLTASQSPEPFLDDSILASIRHVETHLDPSQKVQIFASDVDKMFTPLKIHIIARIFQDSKLRQDMERSFPREHDLITQEVATRFTSGLAQYFERTLRESGTRTVSIRQMRGELDVYTWTMLQEWIATNCSYQTQYMTESIDRPDYLKTTELGVPGSTATIWKACAEDVIGLMVWRQKQVEKHEEIVRLSQFLMGTLGLLAMAALVSLLFARLISNVARS